MTWLLAGPNQNPTEKLGLPVLFPHLTSQVSLQQNPRFPLLGRHLSRNLSVDFLTSQVLPRAGKQGKGHSGSVMTWGDPDGAPPVSWVSVEGTGVLVVDSELALRGKYSEPRRIHAES